MRKVKRVADYPSGFEIAGTAAIIPKQGLSIGVRTGTLRADAPKGRLDTDGPGLGYRDT